VKKLLASFLLGGSLLLGVNVDAAASYRIYLQKDITPSTTQAVVDRAMSALGTPYRWGGSTLGKGFDCSGLVKYAFGDVDDLDLPRTSRELSRFDGPKVARSKLKPGDLLFFKIRGRSVDHVAIYVGEGRFIHAPRRGAKVRIDRLSNSYWQKHFQLARRVVPAETQLAAK
jgi:murein DD-endopeptidase